MARAELRGNKWRLIAYLGYDPVTKKQITEKDSVPAEGISEYEAKRLANEFELKCLKRKNFTNNTNLTVNEFVDYWREEYATKDDHYSEKSLERNEELLGRVLIAIGAIRLKKLKPTHIMKMLNMLREVKKKDSDEKLSPRSVQMHFTLISAIFNKAVQWGFMDDNPCKYVDRPKAKSAKTKIWGEEDLLRFFELLYRHASIKNQLFFTIAFLSGFRRGEICALRPEDFNTEELTISVVKNNVLSKTGKIITRPPKTDKSEDRVHTSELCMELFKLYMAEREKMKELAGAEWVGSEFLFVNKTGGPVHPTSFPQWLTKFSKRHGLPVMTVKGFRNMCITYAIDRGFDLKAVQEHARHSQLRTTTDIYAHVLPKKDRALADSLNEMIKKSKPTIAPEFYGDFI